MAKTDLTADRLREVLEYNPDTGDFTWKRPGGNIRKCGLAGSINAYGRRTIKVDFTPYYASRLAWLYVHGEWPSGVIDHINGIVDDNRFSNLRDVTCGVNQQNRRRGAYSSRSGLLGVSQHRSGWQANIDLGGVRTYLGLFQTKDDAYAAYVAAKRAMHQGCTI